jgi:hypothetical protein
MRMRMLDLLVNARVDEVVGIPADAHDVSPIFRGMLVVVSGWRPSGNEDPLVRYVHPIEWSSGDLTDQLIQLDVTTAVMRFE